MSDVKVLETLVAGDELIVKGEVDSKPTEAHGWVSATRNHYDEKDYEDVPHEEGKAGGRHLKADAKPRTMSPNEVHAYLARLLREAAGSESAPKKVQLI